MSGTLLAGSSTSWRMDERRLLLGTKPTWPPALPMSASRSKTDLALPPLLGWRVNCNHADRRNILFCTHQALTGRQPRRPGSISDDRSSPRAGRCGFLLHLALENFLGYRREFLPARGLIVRNVHIGKPCVRRGVFWPPVALGSGLFAADATRAAAFGA
jgi:hypothetical protein